MKRTTATIVTVLVLLGVGLCWGFLHLRAEVNTYDQRYSDCMEIWKSWQPRQQLSYPSQQYDAASKQCSQQAAYQRKETP